MSPVGCVFDPCHQMVVLLGKTLDHFGGVAYLEEVGWESGLYIAQLFPAPGDLRR